MTEPYETDDLDDDLDDDEFREEPEEQTGYIGHGYYAAHLPHEPTITPLDDDE